MMQELIGDRRFKGLVALVLVLAGVALAAYAYYAFTQARQIDRGMYTVSVMGTSEKFLKPDIATFSFSVVAEDKVATVAQDKSAEAINAITTYLKEQGIDEKDIKTEGYYLTPKKEWTQSVCTQWNCPPGKEVLVGYTVDQVVSVKVRKIETAGDLLSGVGDKGATNISGIVFAIDDMDKAREEVRAEAIAEAKTKAQRLAESLDVRLGKLQSYYEENPNYPTYGSGYGGVAMEKSMDAAQVAPSVTPGENKVISTVTLNYEIR